MNQNPWYVDGLAAYERDRVRSEMKQIRLEEAAMKTSDLEQTKGKTRAPRPGLLMQIVLLTMKWLVSVGR